MATEVIKMGMLGLGTVGGGVASIILNHGATLQERTGMEIQLKRVLVRDVNRRRTVDLPREIYTTAAEDILGDPSINLVLELMGGIEPARSYIATALERGKYVVTANKDLMALHGQELLELARRHNRNIFYEASVGGGIPLIRPLKQSLLANHICRIAGIINGTTNYILTRMDQDHMTLDEALARARALGFAEADPSSDLEGRDAAYKLAILASLAFHRRISLPQIHVEGIGSVTREDIRYARELGYTIKLLAVGEQLPEGLCLRVHPALVPLEHPLASVMNEFNAVFIEGDAVGEVMFYGRGAGSLPTASSVLADVLEAGRCLRCQVDNGVLENNYREATVLPMDALVSSFYLRLQVQDRPGVFAALANAFGDEQVSLGLIIQKRSENGIAEIVLVTHDVVEERFRKALQRIMEHPAVQPGHSVFRVLG
ncbi:MAG TPA: homoserine dehydrogenase [Bacillota bacterium]|nr:homoserine dehydrogenase [Bacillota bacterium]